MPTIYLQKGHTKTKKSKVIFDKNHKKQFHEKEFPMKNMLNIVITWYYINVLK